MEDIKRSIDQIHAPKELLARTMEKMHEENERLQQEESAPIRVLEPVEAPKQEETGKVIYLRRHIRQIAALAACLVLVLGGTIYYQSTNRVTWNILPAGTIINNGNGGQGLPSILPTYEQQLAELYKTEKTKKIEGVDVLFIRDEENDVYIAYWEKGSAKSTYVSDPGTKEKDFLEEVKTMLKK